MTGQMAVLGAGKTGVGWAARFALMGWHVRVFDPAPKAKTRLSGAILAARACLPALYDVALPPAGASAKAPDLVPRLTSRAAQISLRSVRV